MIGLHSSQGKGGNGGSGLRALTLNRVGRVAAFWRANRGTGLPEMNAVNAGLGRLEERSERVHAVDVALGIENRAPLPQWALGVSWISLLPTTALRCQHVVDGRISDGAANSLAALTSLR